MNKARLTRLNILKTIKAMALGTDFTLAQDYKLSHSLFVLS